MRSFYLSIVCLCLGFSASVWGQSGDYDVARIDAKAGTFDGKVNGQVRTFRVRPGVEVTINGLKASFGEMEPGMKVKVVSAEPGTATKLAASGLRTLAPGPAAKPPMGAAAQPARQQKATIPANSMDAHSIGDVHKGTKLSLQYLSGQWKCEGRLATANPDDTDSKFEEKNRLVISTPSVEGKPGEVIAVVPGGTAKQPFVFEADKDYPGLVLRIHDYNDFSKNPGSVDYIVKVLPPVR